MTPTADGYQLKMSFELHDEKIGDRFGCEQTNRYVMQYILDNGNLGEEGFDNPNISEEEFAEMYITGFLKFATNIRPYKDLRGFYENLQIWYAQNCMTRNRLESNPEWFLNLPVETLKLSHEGAPIKKVVSTPRKGTMRGTIEKVKYHDNKITFTIQTNEYPEVVASKSLAQKVYDPFQLNLLVSSLEYHEGFEYPLRFKNIFVDYPFDMDDAASNEAIESEIYEIEAQIKVHGSKYLPIDGIEHEVWAVDVTGFEGIYHPLFDLYDSYHRNFANHIRYYIAKESGKILMMETLSGAGSPRSIYVGVY